MHHRIRAHHILMNQKMKKGILHTLLIIICLACSIKNDPKTKNAAVWTISNTLNSFNPLVLTITQGDSVNFHLESSQNVVEVSLDTWNTYGRKIQTGFSLPYGGGTLHPSQLSVGKHYYVSSLHSIVGMKGIIVVKQ
jgi:plastocyanin